MTAELISAPIRYAKTPGNAALVFDAICKVLSERREQVGWKTFGVNDWQLLLQMARAERVGPLLYWNFKDDAWPPGIPLEVAVTLVKMYDATRERNEMLFAELERILTALDEANIPVIVLKGAALAQTRYEDIGLRPMADLDVLVPQENLEQAVLLVEQKGYAEFMLSAPKANRAYGHHAHMVNPEQIHLELHWSLVGGEHDLLTPDMAWFWTQARPWAAESDATADYQGMLVLSPEANLLFLSAHMGLQHGLAEARLIWFLDFYSLLKSAERQLDWKLMLSQAQAFAWGAALKALTSASAQFFDYTVPAIIDTELMALATWDADLLQAKSQRMTRVEAGLLKIKTLKGSQRRKYFLMRLFPSPKHMRYHYRPDPAWSWPLYYPYRWADIGLDVLRTVWQRAAGAGK